MSMVVKKVKKVKKAKGCGHWGIEITYHPETGKEFSRHCSPTSGCGAQLEIGYSYEQPTAVEIRAAALVAGARSRKAERFGMSYHGFDCVEIVGTRSRFKPKTVDDFDAGWLCREMWTHDKREERDACAWTWNISRPIAGQYEEWLAREWLVSESERASDVEAAADFICNPSPLMMDAQEARLAEQTRHDVAASVARHATLPESLDAVSDLLAKRGEDAPQVEHGEDVQQAEHEDVSQSPHGEGSLQGEHGEDLPQAAHGEDDLSAKCGEDSPQVEHGEDATQVERA